MLRTILLGLGALLALLGLAALALPLFIDANAFRPQIEQAVAGRFKRTLSINGDLRLSVFPRLAVVLPKTTLSERESDRTFARLEQARIRVALWPLLAGRFEARAIEITGLDATIERRADGSTSIDDLIGRGLQGPGGQAAGREAVRATSAVIGLELLDARLTLVDGGRTVLTLSQLTLSTGELAPNVATPINLAAAFAAPQGRVQGVGALSGMLSIDPVEGVHAVRSLQTRLTGTIGGNRVELRVDAPRIEFGRAISGERLEFRLWPTGADDLFLLIEVAAVEGSWQRLELLDLRLDAKMLRGARKIAARLTGAAQLSLAEQSSRLAGFEGEITVDDPALPGGTLKVSVAGGTLHAERHSARLKLDAKFDDTSLRANIDVAGFTPPRVRFAVDADQFNVDRYLPPSGTLSTASSKPGSLQRIDPAAMRGHDLAGEVRVGTLQAAGILATDVRIGLRTSEGRLHLDPLDARLYGGTLSGSASVAADRGRVGLDAALAGVAIEPLLRAALSRSPITGTADVRVNVTTTAGSAVDMLRALEGGVELNLRNGAITGIDIAGRLPDAAELIRVGRSEPRRGDGALRTRFSRLDAGFTLADGVARNDDLEATSDQLRLTGAGLVDLGAGRIDYTLHAMPLRAVDGPRAGELVELRGLSIPVHLGGPLEDITYDIRWNGVARETTGSHPADRVPRIVTTTAAARPPRAANDSVQKGRAVR